MLKNFAKFLMPAFGIIWIIILFLDYWNKHPFYAISLEHFYHGTYAIVSLLLFGLLGAAFKFSDATFSKYKFLKYFKFLKYLNCGLGLLLLAFILGLGATWSFSSYTDGANNFSTAFVYALNGLKQFFFLTTLFLSAYSLGDLVFPRLGIEVRKSTAKIYTVLIGVMIQCFVLFILAIFGGLFQYVILAFLILPIVINYKSSLSMLKELFIKNQITKDSEVNFFTGILLGLGLMFLVINYLGAMSPFPSGFDSRNYYVNISKLLQDYNGLVEGFQTYTWSLYMSIGNIAFGNITTTLLISYSGILLSLWVVWELCRGYLKLSLNATLASILFISLVPAIFNQMYIELKIDFGLLFVQLSSFLLIINIIEEIKAADKSNEKVLMKLFILLGLFSGFALGIKATHLYMLFALVMLIWTVYCQYYGFLASFFIIFFVVLMAGLDDVSGMRAYHLGVSYLKYIVLLLGIVFFALSVMKNRQAFLSSFKYSVILSVLTLLVFSPWVVKNYSDTSSFSINRLIMGEEPGPDLNIQKVIRNYNKSKKNNNE